MATLYQNKGHWLLTVQYKGRRLTRSLRTKDKKVAKQLKPYVESQLILELTGLKKTTPALAFPVLSDRFLKASNKRAAPKTYMNMSLNHILAVNLCLLTLIAEQYSSELLMRVRTGD